MPCGLIPWACTKIKLLNGAPCSCVCKTWCTINADSRRIVLRHCREETLAREDFVLDRAGRVRVPSPGCVSVYVYLYTTTTATTC